jgi:hypothetical protein
MDMPTVLYRGAQEALDILLPAPILETEQHRFPQEVKSVVFASRHQQEALAYAIASRKNLGNFQIIPFWKDVINKEIGWKLTLPCSKTDLPLEDTTYLYELNPIHFKQNADGEFYSTQAEVPLSRKEYTFKEALNEFDEVHFQRDETKINGEGNNGMLR